MSNMLDLDLEELVRKLVKTLDSDVDEIGVVFQPLEAGYVEEGTKFGISHKVLPKLSQYAKTLDDINERLFIQLICSGDNYSAWARRKEMLSQRTTSIGYEFRVTDIILSKQPKSGGAWEHRKYLAEYALKACSTDHGFQAFIQQEIALSERVLNRHPRTYFAWSHLSWLSGWMPTALLQIEIIRVRSWLERNPSDGSAFNHLDQLLSRLDGRNAKLILNRSSWIVMVMNELSWCAYLCRTYIAHEAVWTYRRAVGKRMVDIAVQISCVHPSNLPQALRSIDLDCTMSDEARFGSYDWWLGRCNEGELPNLDSVLQVVLDECSANLKRGLGDASIDEYASENPKKVLIDRKFALGFSGWLSNLCSKSLLQPALAKVRPMSEPEPAFPIYAGCLRNTSLDDLVAAFDEDPIDLDTFLIQCKQLPELARLPNLVLIRFFQAVDTDRSNSLSRTEFLAAAVILCGNQIVVSKEKIKKSFELLDTNKSGILDRDELLQYCLAVLKIIQLGRPEEFAGLSVEDIANATVDEAFTSAKTREVQGLSYDEFITWMQNTTSTNKNRPSSLAQFHLMLTLAKSLIPG